VTVLNLLAGVLGGVSVTILGGLIFRRRTKAETADLITQAAERVLRQVQDRNDRLERDVALLWTTVHKLAALVRTHGGNPDEIVGGIGPPLYNRTLWGEEDNPE
jgi:hypothetical protein